MLVSTVSLLFFWCVNGTCFFHYHPDTNGQWARRPDFLSQISLTSRPHSGGPKWGARATLMWGGCILLATLNLLVMVRDMPSCSQQMSYSNIYLPSNLGEGFTRVVFCLSAPVASDFSYYISLHLGGIRSPAIDLPRSPAIDISRIIPFRTDDSHASRREMREATH